MKRVLSYLKPYLIYCLLAQLFMVGEVSMDLIQPTMMSTIVDEGVLGLSSGGVGDLNLVLTQGLQMILCVVLGGACGILAGLFSNLASQNFSNDVRKDCFRKVMHLSFSQTDQFSTGSLVTRITNDVTQVQNIVPSLTRGGVRALVFFIGGIYCMLRLSVSFGVVIACALPFIIATVVYFLYKATPIFTQLQKKLDRVNSIMQENVSGARVVKAYVQERREEKRFGQANQELVDTQLKALVFFACMSPIMNIVMNIAVVAIIYVGGIQVQAGSTTPGNVMAAITYSSQILNSITSMAMIFQNLTRGTASAKRLEEVLDVEPVIQDGQGAEPKVPGQVEFRNVSFAYPGAGDTVLHDINLTIHPGETLGIMGATGSGKSSLVNLIPRFYDPTEGTVLVDGVDVKDYPLSDLRDKISIALQKSELFRGTIGDNIAIGRPEAGQEELEAAADTAQATEFIRQKAHGFDTPVAEKGMSLSGGQKQRIAISRAVLKGAEILIFDDSTSALDLKTEADLYAALRRDAPNVTKIIIAQRVASVKGANRIAILEGGTIIACAPHEELLRTCPVYQDIYNSQLKGSEQHG
ncbi:MAG: ABC transporter ATP-binding protein/permease [Clostridiales bacterium]|nr:ABC transporter ATP-binding protein/permease [Clostridiales bacterium]